MGKIKMNDQPRILIVDDDESTRRTLSLIFGKQGYGVESAATGQEAIAKARGRSFYQRYSSGGGSDEPRSEHLNR
jgi:CheY-like chemotaxis protein